MPRTAASRFPRQISKACLKAEYSRGLRQAAPETFTRPARRNHTVRQVLFMFGELTDQDIDWMLMIGEKKRVPAGDILLREGEPIDAMYIVLDGTLSVFMVRGVKKELNRLRAGEIIGEMSFLEARPPSATVEALGNSFLLSIPIDQLQTRLRQDPNFAARFYRALALFLSARLRTIVGRLEFGEEGWEEEEEKTNELDPKVLDRVHLAGLKFHRMLKRAMGS